MKNWVGRGLLLAALLGGSGSAWASAPDLFGFGGRVSGMGATGVAHASGYEGVYANPAGLTLGKHKRLIVGYLFGTFDLGMSANMRRIRPPRAEDSMGLMIGAQIPLNFKGWLKNKMWIGMGFYLPTGVVTRARVPLPGQPFFALLESRTQVVGVMVAGAVEPYPGLRIGAGVLALAALEGTVWIGADAAGSIGSTVEQQLIVDYAPIFGLMWTPQWHKQLTIGLAYRGESLAGFDVVLKNTLEDELPIGIPEITINGVAQFDPQQIAFELAYRPLPAFLLVAQVTWKNWSRYPLPTRNVTQASAPLPLPEFKDTVVGRFGLEYVHSWTRWDLSVRGGYFYEPTPVPEQRGLGNLLDNHRHAFTLGIGTAYRKKPTTPFSLDVFFQYHYLTPRSHRKDQAVVAASTDPLLTRYARSSFSTWGHLWVTGVQLGVEW